MVKSSPVGPACRRLSYSEGMKPDSSCPCPVRTLDEQYFMPAFVMEMGIWPKYSREICFVVDDGGTRTTTLCLLPNLSQHALYRRRTSRVPCLRAMEPRRHRGQPPYPRRGGS